ncbi:MAG: CarD family transcriptional regulator [Oscillospiraceae bacterium]
MFSIGEFLVYGSSGVCRVEDICERDCGNGKREYYVLQPVYDNRSTLYIPTDSEKLATHAKALLTEQEIYEIIDNMPEESFDWIANDRERTDAFRNILEEGSRKDIARLMRTIYLRKTELAARGKKLRSADETMMQRAEKLLFGEFAWVLGISPAEVTGFISERVS